MNRLDIQPQLVEDLLVRFLRGEAGKFGFTRAVLGLSGGIDSAVSCALAAKAFGAKNVLAVMMPYKTSNPDSEGDARKVVAQLGVLDARELRDVPRTAWTVVNAPATGRQGAIALRGAPLHAVAAGGRGEPSSRDRGAVLCTP